MKNKEGKVIAAVTVAFALLAVSFGLGLWGQPKPLAPIPLVDPSFLETKTWRTSYADLIAADEDVTQFDCYLCHEEDKVLELNIDDQGKIVLPEEHEDIVMGHGTHGRNNNCYNCHEAENLTLLAVKDGRELKLENSTPLCGSCHGPTYRDWEAGIHGRTSGYWDRSMGAYDRRDCVNCHNPHSPDFPGRKPAPGPHYLRERAKPAEHAKEAGHE